MSKTPELPILLLFAVSCFAFACGGKTDAHATTSETHEPEIDAAEFVAAFERDETAATRQYLGKRVRIAGYLSSVERRPEGGLAMTLKTSQSTFRPVRCIAGDGDAADDAARLNPGAPINVSGRVTGFNESTYYVLLEDCRPL